VKKYKVTFTVEGVPGAPMTKTFSAWRGTTRKELKQMIIRQYGGRKVEILEVHPDHK